MEDFDFHGKTRIIFGKDKENEIGKILKSYKAKHVLLVYGSSSIFNSGLYDKVVGSLKEEKIKITELGNIRPNPTRSQVMCGVYLARKKKIDFILAVGGGSVIDAAKSIGVGYYYDGDSFDFNTFKAKPEKTLPVGVVLTISAAGSECSTSCVISNDATGLKQGFNSELIRPVFVIENPELTFSVPPFQVSCGIVDIIAHSLERLINKSDHFLTSDLFAMSIIKSVYENGKIAVKDPTNYDAKGELMLASSLSHNNLTGLGKKYLMPIHKIEHAVSGMFPRIAHGEGLAVLIPIYLFATLDKNYEKYAKIGKFVFNINFDNEKESAKIFVQKLKDFFIEIGMPSTFGELGIKQDDVLPLVDMMTENGTRVVDQTVTPLSKDEIVNAIFSYGF